MPAAAVGPMAGEDGLPTFRALRADARRRLARSLVSAVRAIPQAPGKLRRAAQQLRDAAADVGPRAPRTSLPGRLGSHRRLVAVRRPLAEVHVAGHAAGATINDVLLAAVAAGMRALLGGRGDRVDGLVLRASVPVGAHPGSEGMLVVVGFPVGEPDARRRLEIISAEASAVKARVRLTTMDEGKT